jgi:hypothetical protein
MFINLRMHEKEITTSKATIQNNNTGLQTVHRLQAVFSRNDLP